MLKYFKILKSLFIIVNFVPSTIQNPFKIYVIATIIFSFGNLANYFIIQYFDNHEVTHYKISKFVQTKSNFHHITTAFINLTIINQVIPDFSILTELNTKA